MVVVNIDIRVNRSGVIDSNDPGPNGGVENFTIRPAQAIQLWQTGNSERTGHNNDYYRQEAWTNCLSASGTFRDLGTCDAPGQDLWMPTSYQFDFKHHNFDWQSGDSREAWVGGFMPEVVSGSWQSAHRSMMVIKFDLTDYPEFLNTANDGKRSLIIRGTCQGSPTYGYEPIGVDYLKDASIDIRAIATLPDAYKTPSDLATDTTEIIGSIGNLGIYNEIHLVSNPGQPPVYDPTPCDDVDIEIPLTITSLNNTSELITAFTMNTGYDTQPEYESAVHDAWYHINRSLMFHHIWLKCGDG